MKLWIVELFCMGNGISFQDYQEPPPQHQLFVATYNTLVHKYKH